MRKSNVCAKAAEQLRLTRAENKRADRTDYLIVDQAEDAHLICHVERRDGAREYGFKFQSVFEAQEYAEKNHLEYQNITRS